MNSPKQIFLATVLLLLGMTSMPAYSYKQLMVECGGKTFPLTRSTSGGENHLEFEVTQDSLNALEPLQSAIEQALSWANRQNSFFNNFTMKTVAVSKSGDLNQTINLSYSKNPTFPAYTSFVVTSCPKVVIDAADITVEMYGANWTATTTEPGEVSIYGGNSEHLGGVLLHEIGHTLGLFHEGRYYGIMTYVSQHAQRANGLIGYSWGADAAKGLTDIYGTGVNVVKNEVSVSHWKRIGQSPCSSDGTQGDCSVNARTAIYDTSNNELSSAYNTVDNELFYRIPFGTAQIRPQFTFENSGPNPVDVTVKYYLSADRYIDTADRLLRSLTLKSLARGIPDTHRYTINLPGDLPANSLHFLGVIISAPNEIDPSAISNSSSVQVFYEAPPRTT